MAEIDGRTPNAAAEKENTARADVCWWNILWTWDFPFTDWLTLIKDGVPVDVQCPPQLGWEYADYDAVIWGYEYLKDIVQPINVEPEHCLKVFCIGNSGIFVCNPVSPPPPSVSHISDIISIFILMSMTNFATESRRLAHNQQRRSREPGYYACECLPCG
jgi:hypothetical protein